MPLLDVSDLLTDPDFVDNSLTCTRSAQTVGDDGMAVNTPTVTAFSGVVTNDTGDQLMRGPDGARIDGSITIHTRFQLIDGKVGFDADVVTWQGRQYTVVNVRDWSTYGQGFVAAQCALIPFSGG
jgi:hypothetical protein